MGIELPNFMELKVISCKDLKAFNFFQKLNVYVIISIVSDEDSSPNKKKKHQQHKTPIDREGDGNPEWNHEIRFDLKKHIFSSSLINQDHLFLEFCLLCEGTIFGDKTIGKVRVPFQDLINEFNGSTAAIRFVSYQVRTPDGIPNGVLNFSYKLMIIDINNNNQQQQQQISNQFQAFDQVIADDDDNGVYTPPMPPPPRPPLPLPLPPPPSLPSNSMFYPPPPIQVHNPSPETTCYPKIEFHNPSPEIHYPTLIDIHSPLSEESAVHHNYYPPLSQLVNFPTSSSFSTEAASYVSPSPLSPGPPPSPDHGPHYHHHHYPRPPQVVYYPPPTQPLPLCYHNPTIPPIKDDDCYEHGFEHGGNYTNPAAIYGHPNHWASTPIHW